MRLLLSIMLAFSLLGLSGAVRAQDICSTATTDLSDPLTAGIWQSINDTRTTSGENALEWSDQLAGAAAWMARDLAARGDIASDVDSLGRNPGMRATDCGYRVDAQVAESLSRDQSGDPFNTWIIWRQGDVSRMYAILYSPVLYPPGYAVGALGYYTNSSGVTYWVLNAGTLPEGDTVQLPAPIVTVVVPPTAIPAQPTPTPTPIPPTPTAMPTATPVPTAIPTATPVVIYMPPPPPPGYCKFRNLVWRCR